MNSDLTLVVCEDEKKSEDDGDWLSCKVAHRDDLDTLWQDKFLTLSMVLFIVTFSHFHFSSHYGKAINLVWYELAQVRKHLSDRKIRIPLSAGRKGRKEEKNECCWNVAKKSWREKLSRLEQWVGAKRWRREKKRKNFLIFTISFKFSFSFTILLSLCYSNFFLRWVSSRQTRME